MFELRTALPFLLNRVAGRTAILFTARELRRHDITLPMYRVLAILLRQDDQRLGDLAALTDLEISTLSRLIGTMQSRRLVSRRRSGKDARAVRIRITDQGRTLGQRLIAAATNFESVVMKGLGPRQMQEMKRMLGLIDDNVAALEAAAEAGGKARAARRRSAA